ncbi:MAG: 1-acyl-sn-glycerol-3-phosphate acyltransferase [Dysgonamonadaceae bacterium]|jgi:1-acyl-sn-glycerol-3-phosphate acyltransferase|nr:1-acyl-sn-glycerol-3-phosphate acyltransferase [Dysgonamonadaceae bacterium]
MKRIYSIIFKLTGWKSSVKAEILPKCVICVAPHTSNWDFVIGLLFYKSIGGRPHILMKKSWFFFPFKYFLKALGGVPVDRGKRTSLTEQMRERFEKRPKFQLAIAPEGTRKMNPDWKSGFYYIALAAKVPITLAYLDYKKKIVGVIENFMPSGDALSDIEYIKQMYQHIAGKKPAQFAI